MARPRKKSVKKTTDQKKTGGVKATQIYISNSDLPRKTLEDCIGVARPINDTYADTSVSWDEIAAALGRGPQAPTTKYLIWGAQAYGLIIKDGEKFKLTENARKIFMHESETERKEAL